MSEPRESVLRDAIDARWPGAPLPDRALAQALADLADVSWPDVERTLHVLYLEGLETAPTGATVRRRWARDAVEAPEFADAMVTVQEALNSEVVRQGRLDQAVGEAAARQLRDEHPVLAELARCGSIPPRALHGELRAQWRRRYDAAVRTQERRLLLRSVSAQQRAA